MFKLKRGHREKEDGRSPKFQKKRGRAAKKEPLPRLKEGVGQKARGDEAKTITGVAPRVGDRK